MASHYENLVWIKDEKGTVFVCELSEDESKDVKKNVKKYEQLTEEEKSHCSADNEFPFN